MAYETHTHAHTHARTHAYMHVRTHTHTFFFSHTVQHTAIVRPEKALRYISVGERQTEHDHSALTKVSAVICRHGHDSFWNATRHKHLVSLITFLSRREGGIFIFYSQPAGFAMLCAQGQKCR